MIKDAIFTRIINDVIEENTITMSKANEAIDLMINNLKQKVKRDKLKALIVGISGGADSAATAALAQKKNTGVPLIGVSIPMNSTDSHKEKAQWVGKAYCDEFYEFTDFCEKDVSSLIFKSLNSGVNLINNQALVDNSSVPILEGNIKARLRMILLYDLANRSNGMVLSTDNYSEYLMGFWTLNGDVGDYGLIQEVFKGLELPTILKALNVREDIITQKPSDGLKVTEEDSDEAQLGASYSIIDALMLIYLKKEYKALYLRIKDNPIAQKIYSRYEKTQFKRDGTVNLTRKDINLPLL